MDNVLPFAKANDRMATNPQQIPPDINVPE